MGGAGWRREGRAGLKRAKGSESRGLDWFSSCRGGPLDSSRLHSSRSNCSPLNWGLALDSSLVPDETRARRRDRPALARLVAVGGGGGCDAHPGPAYHPGPPPHPPPHPLPPPPPLHRAALPPP